MIGCSFLIAIYVESDYNSCMKKITTIAQELLLEVNHKDIAIDFTCGNGNDTFFLGHQFEDVHAFDIQQQAIDNTTTMCRYLRNVHIHLDSHEHFDKYTKRLDAGIFNLGYLPQSDETITTNAKIVIATLDKVWGRMNYEGRIVLVLYPGFASGKKEACMIEEYCNTLESKYFDVMKYQLINRNDAPYILCIDYHR